MANTHSPVLEAGGIDEAEMELLFKRYSKPAILNLMFCAERNPSIAEFLRQLIKDIGDNDNGR